MNNSLKVSFCRISFFFFVSVFNLNFILSNDIDSKINFNNLNENDLSNKEKRNRVEKIIDNLSGISYKTYARVKLYFLFIIARMILYSKDLFSTVKSFVGNIKNNAKEIALKTNDKTKELIKWAEEKERLYILN